jgi:peptidyl-prolyl cis-trans isomerase D
MLDRMRRHSSWLKWSLGIVVVTFGMVYVPSFLRPAELGAMPTDTVAEVDGRTITVGTFQRVYQNQLNQLRQAYGETFNEQMIRQLGIAQRIVQQLVDEKAIVAEAARIGVTVSDAELRERIIRLPSFQENGQFIGQARYRQLLQMQRPPMREAEFEEQMRDSLAAEKLQAAVTAWVRVADADVDTEFRRRNEKVKLELAVFTAAQFRAAVQPTDAEIDARFAANKESYRVPEKRRVRYLSVDAEALRAKMTVTAQEAQARFEENRQMYSTPEQVQASHILLKTEGKDEAAVRKAAEGVLARVKAGGDFAALAKQYSEDGSKDMGGDLGYQGRGGWVKEFEDVAFGQQVGQTSDLVKSQFGFHIIRTTGKRPASTKTFADVRTQIEDQIKYEKAQAEATKVAEAVAKEIDDPSDLDRVAKARTLAVGDSGLFSREEPLAGLGFAPAVAAEAFRLEVGKTSAMLQTGQGYAFIALAESKPSFLPELAEVKEKVKEDVARDKAVEVARSRAAAMAQTASRGSFAAAAKAAGVEVRTTDLITRGAALPEVGVNQAVEDAVFALQKGQTSGAIVTPTAVVVARATERTDVTPAEIANAREGLRTDLLQQRRGEFFSAYMAKAQKNLRITYNDNAIKLMLGGV